MEHGAKVMVTCIALVAASMLLPELGWLGPLVDRSDLEVLSRPFQSVDPAVNAMDGLSLASLSEGKFTAMVHEVTPKSVSTTESTSKITPGGVEGQSRKTMPKTVRSPFHGHALERLYRGLFRIEKGRGPPVHVVQLGDSEIASDAVTMTIRSLFAARFSDGGPGFVLAMRPWPSYSRTGITHDDPDGFSVRSYPRKQARNKRYGPGGVGFDATEGKGASIALRTSLVGQPCRIRFLYLQQPKSREFRLVANGKTYLSGTSEGPFKSAGVSHDFERCPKRLGFRTRGYSRFRAFGWQIHARNGGVSWSSLGVNGARFSHLTHYADGALPETLKSLSPDAIVFSFGLNVTAHAIGPNKRYPGRVATVLSMIRRALPTVPCMVLGPYAVATKIKDKWTLSPTVEKVIHAQRRAADASGCVFVDRFEELGGAPVLDGWRRKTPRILSGDNVHLTREGARRMGHFVFNRLTQTFDRLRPKKQAE